MAIKDKVLDYAGWRNFQKVIDRAIRARKNSGFNVSDHFVKVNKTVEIGISCSREYKTMESASC